MALLRLDGVGKQLRRYGHNRPRRFREFVSRRRWGEQAAERFWAVRNVSLEVVPGEMLGIIGRNGAGKSTLLRLCGGVLHPTEGTVQGSGHAEAFLDYTAGLQPDLTCHDNVLLGLMISGHTWREAKSLLPDVFEFADLAAHRSSPVRVLSTGMKLRLGFAVATQRRPDLLLLDEVVAVGDASFQERSSARIAAFRKAGTAIVLVSHDLSLIKRDCEHVAWLHDGEVARYGEPFGVVEAYLSAAGGAEAPPVMRPERALTVRCKVNGADGEVAIESGAPVSIRLEVNADRPLGPVIPAVALMDGSRQLLCYVYSPTSLDDRSGRIGIEVTLGHLALPDGQYDLDVQLHERDWKAKLAEKARVARIVVRHAPSGAGTLRPRHEWRLWDLA